MHPRLASWARAVKARHRSRWPVVWLFTDPARMPDVVATVRALPSGCGVVFRHDGVPGRARLARHVARACRAGGLAMVMTAPALPGVGLHLRRGYRSGAVPRLVTSSAHNRLEALRAKRAGAAVVFLSPLFSTRSHPDGRALGGVRWRIAAAGVGGVFALGGIDATTIRAIPRRATGFGAIGALIACGSNATVFRNCHEPAAVAVAEPAATRQ